MADRDRCCLSRSVQTFNCDLPSLQHLALRLYRPYLFEKEFKTVKFAAEPLLQADRERSSIASSERLQLLVPVAPNRLVFRDALCEQKPLYAVDILNPFGSQRSALTADLLTVLLFRRRRLVPWRRPAARPAYGPARL